MRTRLSGSPAAVVLLGLVLALLCGCGGGLVGRAPDGAPIVRIPLRLSNVHLIKSDPPVLVDSGTIGDMEDLTQALGEHGVRVRELGAVIVTHAHGDHAGLALALRDASHAKVFLGAGDVAQARAGENDPLRPTGLGAALLKPFITKIFPSFAPDVVVSQPVDLGPYGVDGQVVEMPGHTAGSLVVVLSNRAAFVGDMIAGGALGGAFFPTDPTEHLYHADRARNRANIEALLRQGIETFYLGHGGPVTRADVIAAFGLTAH